VSTERTFSNSDPGDDVVVDPEGIATLMVALRAPGAGFELDGEIADEPPPPPPQLESKSAEMRIKLERARAIDRIMGRV
jgi:hypothetical protein